MRIEDSISKKYGVASTLEAKEFLPFYAERVHKFLKDNSSMGEDWIRDAASKLLVLNKNKEAEVTNSNSYTQAFIATYIPEFSLITGLQLKDLREHTNNKTPFGPVNIDFGMQANGQPTTNPNQAKILLEDYKKRGINNKEIWVPNYSQLKLIADKNSGLSFKLAEDVLQKNLTPASAYNFYSIHRNGLFRAFFYTDGFWYPIIDDLSYSDGNVRVVRYDAEGVEIRKIESPKKDLADKLTDEFLAKIK